MKRLSLIAIVMVFALTALSFTAGKGVSLRLKPNQNKTYVIESKSNQTTLMKVQSQTMRMSQTIEARQTFITKEVSENKVVVETQLEAIKFNMSQMGMNLTYDSENPQSTSPMLANQASEFDKLINKPTLVSYDELGHNEDPADIDMNQLSNIIIELPEEELNVGSTWTCVKTQDISEYSINVNMTYTVTGISKKSVEVSFVGTVDAQEITGTYEGTASISPVTGLVMSCSVKNNISLTVSEQGMTLPVTVSGTSTITVVEK
jgi:predicted DNA binding CopG/RHH family protein